MEIINLLKQELDIMHIPFNKINLLQVKDGVAVARVQHQKGSFVLKYFQRDDFKREILNYQILQELQIPTLQVFSLTESSILLEDILCNQTYRMANETDLDDPDVAKLIAKWYRSLHAKGYEYVSKNGKHLYSESDFFTLEAIEKIKYDTKTENYPAWQYIEDNYSQLLQIVKKIQFTLTYNDFYYTNMVVAKDNSSAMMFDYNLFGKNYAYSDVRNVLSSLSPKAKEAFLLEYGAFDPKEAIIDDVISVVVTLYLACQREKFPSWANPVLNSVKTDFIYKVERMLTECKY